MEYKYIKQSLLDFGYSLPMVKVLMVGRKTPPLLKALDLQEKYGIPVVAWKDIKSFAPSTRTKNSIAK